MTTRARRDSLRASAAATAVLAAVSLCLLLLGLTRSPGVEASDTFQFLPRAAHISFVSSAPADQQSATGNAATTDDGDPPGDLLATPPPVGHPVPNLIRLTVAGPAHTPCPARAVATVGCRGPPA